jgi:hypothetical protein
MNTCPIHLILPALIFLIMLMKALQIMKKPSYNELRINYTFVNIREVKSHYRYNAAFADFLESSCTREGHPDLQHL